MKILVLSVAAFVTFPACFNKLGPSDVSFGAAIDNYPPVCLGREGWPEKIADEVFCDEELALEWLSALKDRTPKVELIENAGARMAEAAIQYTLYALHRII